MVMNIREQLEKAARAVGYEFRWQGEPDGSEVMVVIFERSEDGAALRYGPWKPHENDSQSFRLAIDLKIQVMNETDSSVGGSAGAQRMGNTGWIITTGWPYTLDGVFDKYKANRYAILNCAAA
jgi:hypothetical protein